MWALTPVFIALSLAPGPPQVPDTVGQAQDSTAQVSDSTAPAADTTPQVGEAAPSVSELARALSVTEELMVLRDSLEAVLTQQDTLMGPQRQVRIARVRGWVRRSGELEEVLVELVGDRLRTPPEPAGDSVQQLPEAGTEAPEGDTLSVIRSQLREYSRWVTLAYQDQRARQGEALDSLSAARAEATAEELPLIDSESRLRRGQVDTLFMGEAEMLLNAEALGLDAAGGWRELEQAAISRADVLTGRLRLAQLEQRRREEELEDAEAAGLSEAEIARIRNEVRTVERLIDDLSATLSSTSEFLDTRGYPTAGYRQLVIQATGEVTGDILDRDVLLGLLSNAFDSTVRWMRTRGPTILVRGFIVLSCIFLGRLGIRLVWLLFRPLRVIRLPRLATQLIGRTLGPLGTLLGLGIGLWAIGVDATTVLAGAGVAGVVLGFALQDSLANFASGFLLLLYRPFDQDDTIEAAGVVGQVRSMGLANTTLVTFDNRKVSIPNSKLWGTVIANRSSEPTRRVEAVVRVGFDQDLTRVFDVIVACLSRHELVLHDPAPSVHVSGTGDSWLEVKAWGWTENANWWTVTAVLPTLLKAALADEGIPVPLPTQHFVGGREPGSPAP
jgi:small conductance mechanosensitive channel